LEETEMNDEMSLATVFGHENKNENAKHKTVRETQEDKKSETMSIFSPAKSCHKREVCHVFTA